MGIILVLEEEAFGGALAAAVEFELDPGIYLPAPELKFTYQ